MTEVNHDARMSLEERSIYRIALYMLFVWMPAYSIVRRMTDEPVWMAAVIFVVMLGLWIVFRRDGRRPSFVKWIGVSVLGALVGLIALYAVDIAFAYFWPAVS